MTLARWHAPELARRSPFRQLSSLREEIDRLFESPLSAVTRDSSPFLSGWMPSVDLYEEKDALVVKAELPGLKKDEIDIAVHDGVLTLSGERKVEHENKKGDVHRSERFTGRFQRVVALPTMVKPDAVTARYEDGILTVTLPKAEEAKPRKIKIAQE